jgi:predicted RNase H-like HicB family nuclease
VAAGATREETEWLIREAIILHIAAVRKDGEPIPEPTAEAIRITIPAQES